MLDMDFLVKNLEEYIDEHGENELYETGFSEKSPQKFTKILEESQEVKGEELANILVEFLDEDSRAEVLVEEIIESLSESYEDFEKLIEDLEIQSYTPIYILEKYNKVE